MTTFGTINCTPSGIFSVPRSYVGAIIVSTQNQPYTFNGYNLRIAVGVPVVYWMNIHFNPDFMNWNSKEWRLDQVVDEIYYDVNPSPTHQPFTAPMVYAITTPGRLATLTISLGVLLSPFTTFKLGTAAPDYWLPKPLP
jgi:hypothetical protein